MNLQEAIQHAEQQAQKLGNCPCGQEHAQLADWLKELEVYRDIIWGIDIYNVIEMLYLNKFKGWHIELPIEKPIDLSKSR